LRSLQPTEGFERGLKKWCWRSSVIHSFVGRIKPPVGGDEGIQLIKGYLNKNHAYRNGTLNYARRLLVFPSVDVNQNGITADVLNNRLDSIATKLQIYSRDQIDLLTTKDKKDYLNKLAQSHETALINIHGSPTNQWIGDDVYVTSEDIKNSSPNVFFVELYSCSNGAFQDQDYFAGWLLFRGNTLVVVANTVNTFITDLVPDPPFEPTFFFELNPLRLGVSLGEKIRREDSSIQSQTFGDPTLKMRLPPRENIKGPQVFVSSRSVDFGKVQVNQLATKKYFIGNKGKSNLELVKDFAVKFTVDGQDLFDPSRTPPRFLSMGFDDTQTPPRTTIIIKPLEKKEFIGYFRPYTNGEYLGLERFQTNDPKVPYLDIPLTGEGLLPIKTLSP